jgi:hypothetical protein
VNICLQYCPARQEENITTQLYSFHIEERISESHNWQSFIPRDLELMQTDYLQLIENTQAGKLSFLYVLVQRNHKIVGALYFQVSHFTPHQLINYFPEGNSLFNKLAKSVSQKILSSIDLDLLISGNSFMTGDSGFYFHPSVSKNEQGQIFREAVRQIFVASKTIKALVIADLYAPKSEFDNNFKSMGFHETTVESDMSITIRPEWKTFEDYRQSLSSKYRVRCNKVFSLCNENGVVRKDLTAEEIKAAQAEIFSLYQNVMQNASFKLSELTENYFYEQKLQLPTKYKLYAYYRDNVMIGFISAFVLNERMEIHYTGMKHELSKPINLYQHMMYDMVELGIKSSVKKVHFGRTAPEIKSTIGATPSPMYGYIKHRNWLFNALLVKTYTSNLKPKQYTFRNPFK